MSYFTIIIGCQIEGVAVCVGDVVDLDKRLSDKLIGSSRPRIEPATEADYKAFVKKSEVKTKRPRKTKVEKPVNEADEIAAKNADARKNADAVEAAKSKPVVGLPDAGAMVTR